MFGSYGIIDRPSDRMYVRTIPLSRCIDRHSCYTLWVHPSAVINIPPGSSSLSISTTIQTTEGGVVPITVSLSVRLVGVDDGWLNSSVVPICSMSPEEVRDSYRDVFRPYYLSRKRYLSSLFHNNIPRCKSPKRRGQ